MKSNLRIISALALIAALAGCSSTPVPPEPLRVVHEHTYYTVPAPVYVQPYIGPSYVPAVRPVYVQPYVAPMTSVRIEGRGRNGAGAVQFSY